MRKIEAENSENPETVLNALEVNVVVENDAQTARLGACVTQTSQPFFSVIVPAFERPRELIACLRDLAGLEYPIERFEVVIVDDGSSKPLDKIVAPFREKLNLTVLRQPNAGPAMARNAGVAVAQGEYLAFTDDDCAPAPNWLSELACQLRLKPDEMIGGKTVNALPGNPYSTASQLLIDYLYEYYNSVKNRRTQANSQFFASNNIALSRALFLDIGGFTADYTLAAAEDRDLCRRWQEQGHQMSFAPAAVVRHAHRLTARKFWRQHFNYGRGAWNFHHSRAQQNSQRRLRVEPVSFYLNLLRYSFGRKQNLNALWLCALMLVSQIANVVGYLYEKRRNESSS